MNRGHEPATLGMLNTVIQIERARRVVELLGEVREIGIGTEESRLHLATSLLEFLGAASCIVVLDSAHYPDGTRGVGRTTAANLTPELADICEVTARRGCALNLVHKALMCRTPAPGREQIVSATDDIVARRDWIQSELFNEYFRRARVDRYLTSVDYGRGSDVQGFGVFRAAGDRSFSEEDRHALHLLHLGLGPLFAPEPHRVVLTPRVRQTLELLLTGASDKEIAACLLLSPHTVRQYVKSIFRAYGVSSRTHLIASKLGSRKIQSAVD